MNKNIEKSEIIIYQTEDGTTKINVRLENNTVWLTQQHMAELFQITQQNISLHIINIFEERELTPEATHKKYLSVRREGNRDVQRQLDYYNLDVIISVGYRVKSLRGTQFRIWATERLREYLIKGFTMNDELLKNGGGYFEELLARIRDIRSSEKVFYRKVLEIYATSVDYDPDTEATKRFFQTVQNKLHWAAHGHTAAEIIFKRANSNEPFMGLTSFKGNKPKIKDVTIAKNYLREEEIAVLNRLVSAYLDIAEVNAMQRKTMTMADWIDVLNGFIKMSRQNVLVDAGNISAGLAEKKAHLEYSTYTEKNMDELTAVEKHFLQSIEAAEKKLLKKKKEN
ncbi:MAG: virulence RhuM family protein [Chrysiogenales bacterium]